MRVKKEPAERRNDILDAAQYLICTLGYEVMTVQNILDRLQISKGAFYHYFASKQALLGALIERMTRQMEEIYGPIVCDPHLSALEKLVRFHDTIVHWQTARKELLFALLRALYNDDNAILRNRVVAASMEHYAPYLTAIIGQGIVEGVFSTSFPDQAGEISLALLMAMSERITRVIRTEASIEDMLPQTECILAAYTQALERVLGAPTGSLTVMDGEMLREFFVTAQSENGADYPFNQEGAA